MTKTVEYTIDMPRSCPNCCDIDSFDFIDPPTQSYVNQKIQCSCCGKSYLFKSRLFDRSTTSPVKYEVTLK